MAKAEKSVTQIDKFREAARELDADQSEAAFNRVLKKIAKSPPAKEDEPKPTAKRGG